MEGDGDDMLPNHLGHYLLEDTSLRYGEEDKDFGLRYNKLESCLLNIITESPIEWYGIQEE